MLATASSGRSDVAKIGVFGRSIKTSRHHDLRYNAALLLYRIVWGRVEYMQGELASVCRGECFRVGGVNLYRSAGKPILLAMLSYIGQFVEQYSFVPRAIYLRLRGYRDGDSFP